MTKLLYRDDPYLRSCQAQTVELRNDGAVLDQTVFFAAGGGQPGDTGELAIGAERFKVTDTVMDRENGAIIHQLDRMPEEIGAAVAELDWARRYLTMRTHTALHLLYAAVKLPVTGGRMDPGRGRLDFDMPEPPDRAELEEKLAELVAADLSVETKWVDWDHLDANPELVKTMAVRPPRHQQRVSLVEIDGVDIQACGGTHVRKTAEVGKIRIAEVKKKGKINRRIVIEIEDA